MAIFSRSLNRLQACLLIEIAFLLLSCGADLPSKNVSVPVPGGRPFIDTWNDIHLFQTFDYGIADQASASKRYDFVWGAEVDHVSAIRSGNPNTVISYYMPSHQDNGTFSDNSTHHNLAYWKATHPDWILYQCDKTTPAYLFGEPNIPLDFTNPAVISWQVQTYAEPASTSGYDAIAADNVILDNLSGACGVYRNGQWVQLYTGAVNDPRWQQGLTTWLQQMQQALHQLKHPMALIPNLSFTSSHLSPGDPLLQRLLCYLDGVLDEDGFTLDGKSYATDNDWLQKVQMMEYVQQQHKPYFVINQFPSVGANEIQWALASYLMGKEHMAALFISTIQGYGIDAWHDEYKAQIGSPSGSMYQAQHVYLRKYSHGLSIVNPSATETYTLTIQAGIHYVDLYGNSIGQLVALPPHSGMVLQELS